MNNIPVTDVSLKDIVPSRWQPRRSFDVEALFELAKHVKDHGLMYPIIVFRNEDDEYELVAGERRVRAMAAIALTRELGGLRKAATAVAERGWLDVGDLGEATIRAQIELGDDHQHLHELAVADNIQRENLSPVEEARAIHGLMEEHGLSQRDVAKQLGWSQSKVQERLALLKITPEVETALTARAVSTSHVRHIARVPKALQPAVTVHITELIDREGDQAATVRQIAELTRQLRQFIKPDRWLVPEDQVISPQRRNHMRLVHYLVTNLDLEGMGERLLALRSAGSSYSPANYLNKVPLGMGGQDFAIIVRGLTGEKLDKAWCNAAVAKGWLCRHCQLNVGLETTSQWGPPCPRWEGDVVPDGTCRGYIGPTDPLIISLDRGLDQWVGEETLVTQHPFPFVTSAEVWQALAERATAAARELREKTEQIRQNRHVVALETYWEAQQKDQRLTAEHFQAHRCEKCIYHRPELEDLPPCEFAVNPLKSRWSQDPPAPDFGVLIRQDGLMVPRCMHYRIRFQEVAPMVGFSLPNRQVILDIMHQALAGRNDYTRGDTLAGPLAWLPYERPTREKLHDLERLIRYIKHMWDEELADEQVATLLAVATYESKAARAYRGSLKLMDPTTLIIEEWQALSWQRFEEGESPHDYPSDWPRPWMPEAL